LESSNLYTFQKSTEKRRGYLGSTVAIVVAAVLGGFGITQWLNPDQTPKTVEPKAESNETSTSIEGVVVNKGYGDVQVKVTIVGSDITSIEMIKAESTGNRESAFPLLVKAALEANSAEVANVGNATYSSEAFRESLKSALDKAR
jgi:uncharacterized protein with FMN-binding domain